MQTATKSQIIEFIKKTSQATAHQITLHLGLSPQAIHRQLKGLIETGILQKAGSPPRVYYFLTPIRTPTFRSDSIPEDTLNFLKDRYLYVNPKGHLLKGIEGFRAWTEGNNQARQMALLAEEFVKTRKTWDQHFLPKTSLIDARAKFQSTFTPCYLDKAYYLDFYSLPKFGKTALGALVLYAKQAQNRKWIREVAEICRAPLQKLIKLEKIDAISWVPHSLPRKIPFLKELRENLKIPLPEISFLKAYSGELPIPQKSLSKLSERIENAESTLFLKDPNIAFNRILILDDAVGSGATLHAISKKIKSTRPKALCVGFAIVGSLKGFEVIKEV